MRIALLHYSSPPIVGGVESVLAHHARLMTKAGHQVTIIVGRGKSFDERISVHVFPRMDSRHPDVMQVKALLDKGNCTPAFDTLRDEIKGELSDELKKYDVLIAHNIASLHKNLPLTAAIQEASKQPDFPKLILWHHDLAWTTPRYKHDMHDGYPWNLLRTPWKGVKQVVISEMRRQELSALLGIDKADIQVIPNGVNLNAFYKLETRTIQIIDQLSLFEANPLFLLPVRLTPRKNIELALRIMAELVNDYPKAMLVITGPEGPHNPANKGYKEKLLHLRDELKLQGIVHFLAESSPGMLPDAVIADFYRLGNALLFPSREEGFGIPIIEAAFSSMPVFCADIQVLRELACEDASYFDPEGDPKEIARLIVNRMESEATSRLSRRVKRSYTWESIYSKFIEPMLKEET
jgi:glycosyltransferase involved in cell wall biosynthesis